MSFSTYCLRKPRFSSGLNSRSEVMWG